MKYQKEGYNTDKATSGIIDKYVDMFSALENKPIKNA